MITFRTKNPLILTRFSTKNSIKIRGFFATYSGSGFTPTACSGNRKSSYKPVYFLVHRRVIQRFGQMAVHAGIFGGFNIFGKSIGRHR